MREAAKSGHAHSQPETIDVAPLKERNNEGVRASAYTPKRRQANPPQADRQKKSLSHRAVGPSEVVVDVRQVRHVRAEQLVELPVGVVPLHRRRRVAALVALGLGVAFAVTHAVLPVGVRVPRGEQVVEGLEVLGVVADARVVRVPRLIEVFRSESLQVPQPVRTKPAGGRIELSFLFVVIEWACGVMQNVGSGKKHAENRKRSTANTERNRVSWDTSHRSRGGSGYGIVVLAPSV